MASVGLRVSNNALNQNDKNKLTKRSQNENVDIKKTDVLPAKRAALSTLSSNNIRIQPFRAAKAHPQSSTVSHRNSLGNSSEANIFGKIVHSDFNLPSQGFSIYVDEDTSKSKSTTSASSENLDLDPVVTTLSRKPLTEVFTAPSIQNACYDSPMFLDSSADEDCEGIKDPIKDIDTSCDTIIDVPEYAAEIHQYLKIAELKHRPKSGYMKKQPDINNSMRAILVDWLVEVAEEYRLSSETLYLSVNYIDRFLSSMVVLRKKLQLVGTACVLIASKLEEIYPPEVAEFVYITDDTYSDKEVRKMESLVLKVLEFDLCVPTILSFLNRYRKAADVPEDSKRKLSFLTKYICELTLQDADPYLKYQPSTIAASAVVLALHILELPSWTPSLKHYTGVQLASLNDCISDLHRTFSMASNHPQKAIREKYSDSRFLSVANIPSPTTIPLA